MVLCLSFIAFVITEKKTAKLLRLQKVCKNVNCFHSIRIQKHIIYRTQFERHKFEKQKIYCITSSTRKQRYDLRFFRLSSKKKKKQINK